MGMGVYFIHPALAREERIWFRFGPRTTVKQGRPISERYRAWKRALPEDWEEWPVTRFQADRNWRKAQAKLPPVN